MCRPSQTPNLSARSAQISRQRGQIWRQNSQRRSTYSDMKHSGISRSPEPPLMLHFLRHCTKLDWRQTQHCLLSQLIIPTPFPWRWFRKVLDRGAMVSLQTTSATFAPLPSPTLSHTNAPSTSIVSTWRPPMAARFFARHRQRMDAIARARCSRQKACIQNTLVTAN